MLSQCSQATFIFSPLSETWTSLLVGDAAATAEVDAAAANNAAANASTTYDATVNATVANVDVNNNATANNEAVIIQ